MIYTGSAFLGRSISLVSAIFITIVIVIYIWVTMGNNKKLTGRGQALVVNQNEIAYQIENVKYTKKLPLKNNINEIVNISFEPTNPKNVQIGEPNIRSALIVCGILLVIFWGFFLLTLKYKPFAAFEGAAILIPGA